MSEEKQLSVWAMLRQGCVGGLGAIPGTLCAHPCDVIKIRMQISGAGSYANALHTVTGISFVNGKMVGNRQGMFKLYNGLFPAIEQRIVARGPMFLVSELYTQLVTKYLGLQDVSARFVGSVGSGYTVGVMAGIAEYRKKLLSQAIITPKEARWDLLYKTAVQSGNGASLRRRLHGAGVCAAIFDSIFFSTQHHLQYNVGFAAPIAYASAAACAVCVGFTFDTNIARMMVVPPDKPVDGYFKSYGKMIWNAAPDEKSAALRMLKGVRGGFRGLPARVCEFSISYGVTGAVSIPVIAYFGLN